MNIKIHSKNFDITPAIKDYINKKISSLEKFLEIKEGAICEVEIGRTTQHHKSGDIFRAEVNMLEIGNKQVYAVAEEVDLYTAIDIVRDEAERTIVSRKSKRFTMIRRGGAVIKNILKSINMENIRGLKSFRGFRRRK